jgi:magnesium-transporting ATPase (P-type)
MTSPPYASTTAWYFYGSTGIAGNAVTATAVPYKAGSESTATSNGGAAPGSTNKASSASVRLQTQGIFVLVSAAVAVCLIL